MTQIWIQTADARYGGGRVITLGTIEDPLSPDYNYRTGKKGYISVADRENGVQGPQIDLEERPRPIDLSISGIIKGVLKFFSTKHPDTNPNSHSPADIHLNDIQATDWVIVE